MLTGFLNIDKPQDLTSHDVVALIRKLLATGYSLHPKIGHAGTLDPFATGVLIVGVGREATRRLAEFHKYDKEYIATIALGAISDTDDSDGKITKTQNTNPPAGKPNKTQISNILQKFIGDIKQKPPAYAAIKAGGEKLYEKARRGETFNAGLRDVTIHEIEILEYKWPELELRVVCSTGTYIRALARDIGEELSVGGYCSALTRTRIGERKIENAVPLDSLSPDNIEEKMLPVDVLG